MLGKSIKLETVVSGELSLSCSPWLNIRYTTRAFGGLMARAAKLSIVEVSLKSEFRVLIIG